MNPFHTAPTQLWSSIYKTVLCILLVTSILIIATGPPAAASAPQVNVDSGANTYNCASAQGIDANDCAVLLALYDQLGGEYWAIKEGWLTNNRPCSWLGMVCKDGRVSEITIGIYPYPSRAQGTIPPELGQLSHLETLFLIGYGISGEIPPELGQLSNLETLYLYNTQVGGEIPPELGQLSNLKRLNLSNMQISGEIPAELGRLSTLKEFNLANNNLSGEVPTELGQLAVLESLALSDNFLTGQFPPEIMQLPTLDNLILSGNSLTTPAYDCALANGILANDCAVLVKLYNSLNGLAWHRQTGWLGSDSPCSWFGITCEGERVTKIDLGAGSPSQIGGELPAELGQLSALTKLRLSGPELGGSIPPELGQLANLTELILFGNELYGPIPPALGALSNLTKLDLAGRNLSGAIPPELGQLSALTELWIQGTKLSGPIPSELGQLAALTWLELSNNMLNGAIPSALGEMASLEILDLSQNQLSGQIPPELGQLSAMRHMTLAENQLGGTIPAAFGQLTNLSSVQLQDNQLTGAIPSEFGLLSNLETLNLANNQLSSAVPTELGQLQNLIKPELAGNQLTPAPYDCTQAVGIDTNDCAVLVTLYHETDGLNWVTQSSWLFSNEPCRWSGIDCTDGRVSSVALSFRRVSGETLPELGLLSVLEKLGQLSALEELTLSHAELHGEIPPFLAQLSTLTKLDLSDNQFSGAIPAELGQLSNITWLDLSSNELTGEIPMELGQLSTIRDLDLSDNHLTGGIPTTFSQLSDFRRLNLAYNALSGPISEELVCPPNTPFEDIYDIYIGRNMFFATNQQALNCWTELDRTGSRTQTVPPTNVQVRVEPELGTHLSWTPALYTAGDGYYEVGLSTDGGTTYDVIATTDSKYESGILIQNLEPESEHIFAVRTITKENYGQRREWVSPFSDLARVHTILPDGQNTYLPTMATAQPYDCSQAVGIRFNDCAALLALYEETNGQYWYDQDGWLVTDQPCTWERIACAGTGVIQLNLSSNHLTGAIPASLSQLSTLTHLDLSGNELHGQIPPTLGDLSALQWLILTDNQLSGEIPIELGQLDYLVGLDLSRNRLNGEIPVELGQPRSLLELNLSYNRLSGEIPEALSCDTFGGEWAHNMLYPSSACSSSFNSGVGLLTQTIYPAAFQAVAQSPTSARLSWEPIAYIENGGYYEIGSFTNGDETYEIIATTGDKTASSIDIENLMPDSSYTFAIRTFTPAYSAQPNELTSEFSPAVNVNTLPLP